MDESTLNDLLECSVCLDRLDTNSKVLPCQHTFCRSCLEVIVHSHRELRCPECRILVNVKIEDLPPNVLLMRILEGLKNTATNVKSTTEPSQEKTNENENPIAQENRDSVQQQQQQAHKIQRPHAYALYDFNSNEISDLKFKKGDLIFLKRKIDTNWYVGQLNGVEGTFPSNYVQIIIPLPTPQAIALYDFKMGPNEEEGCLQFKKGAVIHVLRRVDQNWAEGRINNMIGIFPIAFVELNILAKKLLDRALLAAQQQQQLPQGCLRNLPPIPLHDSNQRKSETTASSPAVSPNSFEAANMSNANAAAATSSTSNLSTFSNSLPTSPEHYVASGGGGSVRYRNGREKRHSLNALLTSGDIGTTSLSILQTNRHSAEILSIPSEELIVNQDTQQENVAGTLTNACEQQRQHVSRMQTASTSSNTRANVLKTACGRSNLPPSLPWGYLALYPYKPRKSDELELKKGCVYIVTERCLDGWFKGKNWQDISGVFPGNYVTPLRARDQQQLMHQCKFVPQKTAAQPLNVLTKPTTNSNQPSASNNIQNPLQAFATPPELPPRHVTTTTCAPVWTKPLSQTVESFFSRSSAATKTEESPKEKAIKPKESSSSGAAGLMKLLTNIKSRAKSPGAVARATAAPSNAGATAETTLPGAKPVDAALQTLNLQPVHTRSGSCPSQLLQNLPHNANLKSQTQPSQQQQQQQLNLLSHGSERIKGHKERPRIQVARQSMNGGIYANVTATNMISNNLQLNPKCAQQFQMQQYAQMNHAGNHRKSHSLDSNNLLSSAPNTLPLMSPPSLPPTQMPITAAAIAQSATTKSNCGRESRFRCIVPYPSSSDVELELHVGDIIYVQRKQKNGWYKGTHAKTQKTGLFPASFVEPDL